MQHTRLGAVASAILIVLFSVGCKSDVVKIEDTAGLHACAQQVAAAEAWAALIKQQVPPQARAYGDLRREYEISSKATADFLNGVATQFSSSNRLNVPALDFDKSHAAIALDQFARDANERIRILGTPAESLRWPIDLASAQGLADSLVRHIEDQNGITEKEADRVSGAVRRCAPLGFDQVDGEAIRQKYAVHPPATAPAP